MKDKRLLRFQEYSLFLLFIFLSLFTTVKAQTTNLEGTQWTVPPFQMVNIDNSITLTTQTYSFERNGKLTLFILTSTNDGIQPFTNIPTSPKTVSSLQTGTYRINGKTVFIDFPEYTVTATLQSDLLEGFSTDKRTNKKAEWSVGRFEGEKNSSLDKSIRASNEASNSTSDVTSSQFSLSEFQNSYFKPVPLTQNTISGTNPEGSVNTHNYSFVADSGEIIFTFSLTASQDSFASSVSIEVQDRKNNIVAEKFVNTNRGKTAQTSVSINVSEKQAMLLRVKPSGGSSYQIRLNGSLVFGKDKDEKIVSQQTTTSSDNSKSKMLPSANSNANEMSSGIAGYQQWLREESAKELQRQIAELSKLLTYKAVAKLTYRDSVVNATLLIKIKSVDENGKFTAELKGIKGVFFSGICTNQLPVKDVDTFDFGDDSEPLKLSCLVIPNVKDWGLADGTIEMVSIAQRKLIVDGKFTVIESTR